MKKFKYINLFIIALSLYFINNLNTYAYSVDNYASKSLCGTFELDSFAEDGSITTIGCYSNYDEAKNAMKSKASDDLGILTGINGQNKIIDANTALLDLSVNPTTLTYFYRDSNLTSNYTYMDTGSLYGGVDGVHLESAYSSSKGKWVAKVQIASLSAWIPSEAYEIVPITWVKSSSSYTVTSESIRHNYVAKIQNAYNGSSGSTIGPKPSVLNIGTYYSYDGHYFYTNLKKLIKDQKNNTHENAVNKTAYYNYYMYLSNHTKTTYSSTNIDEYIRNNMGYTKTTYGTSAKSSTSKLYGMGTFFYNTQEQYGVNALLSLSLSRNETANGTSNLAINKNNGFGLNAVDSNPYQAANWYATFASSIKGYATKWITNGYAKATDWRYFGPQFGEKLTGMNVKYAADTYWSEKMAAKYYSLDKAYGLQDYNYYQLGVLTSNTTAYLNPTTSSKAIYEYPEAEDGVVIVGEVTGQTINGSNIWYKVISDINIDSNGNQKTNINDTYDWNTNYVYVPSTYIKKINNAKDGYKYPTDITEYQDKDYTYDLYVENNNFTPKVAISTKDTKYYYDSTLNSKTGSTLLKDKYIMVYTTAYNKNNEAVAYLVTSDYFYDQKQWVSADSIKFVSSAYGQASVTVSGNQYTWVNYNTVDAKYSLISGLYTYTYVPILDTVNVDGNTWYKVPVDLTSNNNSYGYTLASAPNVSITAYNYQATNNAPVIVAGDKTIIENTEFNELKDVTATDQEDGDISSKIEVTNNTVNIKEPGEYQVTYKVTDSSNESVEKTIKVTVVKNSEPVINAEDKEVTLNSEFDELIDVTATDEEDGDLTSKIEVTKNTVNTKTAGEYEVTYKVTDSNNKSVEKTIKVTVIKQANKLPEIIASNLEITEGSTFNPKDNVKATDEEDGDLTSKIEVIENTVNTKTPGTYKVTYKVTDSNNESVEKTITVKVNTKLTKELTKKEGEFYLDNLSWNTTNDYYTISGYLIILKDNNESPKYEFILKNKDNDKEYSIEVSSWTKNVPYDLGSDDGYDYSNSWFKGKIDLTNIPNGDYDLYMKASTSDSYTETLVNNIFNKDIDKRESTSTQGYSFKVQLSTRSKRIELSIRDTLITTKTSNTFRNMFNSYDDISFTNNNIRVVGTSYNYDGTYSNSSEITRKLILEETTTYKRYTYNIGSTNKGSYTVTSNDNKSKEYAWFDKELDISNLPKGTYAMYIYTKTSDSEDYGELNDIFASINKAETTINNKKYTVTLNKSKNNRIELVVE